MNEDEGESLKELCVGLTKIGYDQGHITALEEVAKFIEGLEDTYDGDCVGNLLHWLPGRIRTMGQEVAGE